MSVTAPTALDARPSGRVSAFWQRLRSGDDIAYVVTLTCALTILALAALLVFELYTNSTLRREKFGWSFLTGTTWDPVAGQYGALPFIYGTIVTSALALLMGMA